VTGIGKQDITEIGFRRRSYSDKSW